MFVYCICSMFDLRLCIHFLATHYSDLFLFIKQEGKVFKKLSCSHLHCSIKILTNIKPGIMFSVMDYHKHA